MSFEVTPMETVFSSAEEKPVLFAHHSSIPCDARVKNLVFLGFSGFGILTPQLETWGNGMWLLVGSSYNEA